jgi:hypothetical protein
VDGHRGSGGFSQPKTLDPAKEGGPPGQLYNLTTRLNAIRDAVR